MKGKIVIVLQVSLGIILLIFGLNGLIDFFALPPTTQSASNLLSSLWETGYLMHFVKLLETLGGVLLITNRFVPLALLLVLPITTNIFLANILLQPQHWHIGCFVLISNLVIIFYYRGSYRSILVFRNKIIS